AVTFWALSIAVLGIYFNLAMCCCQTSHPGKSKKKFYPKVYPYQNVASMQYTEMNTHKCGTKNKKIILFLEEQHLIEQTSSGYVETSKKAIHKTPGDQMIQHLLLDNGFPRIVSKYGIAKKELYLVVGHIRVAHLPYYYTLIKEYYN
ncbi:hypothetical protein ACJX0J_042144, partial [Zea mays]